MVACKQIRRYVLCARPGVYTIAKLLFGTEVANSFCFLWGARGEGKEGSLNQGSYGTSFMSSCVQVVAEVLGLLQQMFGIPDDSFPRPIDFIVSRWDADCFSRGSYSTPVCRPFYYLPS